MYEYQAKYIRNHDGDTIVFLVDLGFSIQFEMIVRVLGINTPELHSSIVEDQQKAVKARDFVTDALSKAKLITLITKKDKKEKYGRYLAEVIYDGHNLSSELFKSNLAIPYME